MILTDLEKSPFAPLGWMQSDCIQGQEKGRLKSAPVGQHLMTSGEPKNTLSSTSQGFATVLKGFKEQRTCVHIEFFKRWD